MRDINQITGEIVDAAYQLHREVGPGLVESVYQMVMIRDLERRGLFVEHEKRISFEVNGMKFENGFRVDLLVEGSVVVELKSVEKLAPVHSKQILTYLRLMNLPIGLLINFGAATFRDGVQRLVNGRAPSVENMLLSGRGHP